MFVAQYLATERHCVLVASSNPFVLPATLESPVLKDGQIRDLQTEYRTVVVDDVAKMFAKVLFLDVQVMFSVWFFINCYKLTKIKQL